jgi:hypothetical protein
VDAFSFVIRVADVLARPAACPDFGFRDVFRFKSGNVIMEWNLRPMPFQYPLTIRVNFAMEDGRNPSLTESEIESADSGEKRSNTHLSTSIQNG